jgi:GNAT superfamily N-acetyltransferase
MEIIELSHSDPEPPVATDGGVALLPAADRALHAADRHLLLIDGRTVVARCSCWWTDAPALPGQRLGAIGHYAAADAGTGAEILARACSVLASAGCTVAVGPMDGNTWRRYRFVIERGAEPPFALEPDNPDDWPGHWTGAGFSILATYASALNDDLSAEDPRTENGRQRIGTAGISIRPFDPGRADADLRRIFHLSLAAFSGNFLYTPISEAEFMAQQRAALAFVRPELVLLAERAGELAGFMFAIPDVLQLTRTGAVDTVILKTMAVDPALSGMGLGGVLMDDVQRAARTLGFRRAIHALMHDSNRSKQISARYARTIRRYALYSKALPPR